MMLRMCGVGLSGAASADVYAARRRCGSSRAVAVVGPSSDRRAGGADRLLIRVGQRLVLAVHHGCRLRPFAVSRRSTRRSPSLSLPATAQPGRRASAAAARPPPPDRSRRVWRAPGRRPGGAYAARSPWSDARPPGRTGTGATPVGQGARRIREPSGAEAPSRSRRVRGSPTTTPTAPFSRTRSANSADIGRRCTITGQRGHRGGQDAARDRCARRQPGPCPRRRRSRRRSPANVPPGPPRTPRCSFAASPPAPWARSALPPPRAPSTGANARTTSPAESPAACPAR